MARSRDAIAAAGALARANGGGQHDTTLVLRSGREVPGSGWTDPVSGLTQVGEDVPLAALPGFEAPTVAGHGGVARSLRVGDARVLAFTGRSHYYESRDPQLVAHAVRTAAAGGCRIVVLTSASGGIRDDLQAGELVLVSDHINLTGASPLVGA